MIRPYARTVAGVMLVAACGDGLVSPERDVASMALARDSAMVEVGDAALVRAEPRDAQGNPLFDVDVSWQSLDPALVSVTAAAMSTYVTGLAPGLGRVSAHAGTVSDTVIVWIPPPITATVLDTDLDTLETLGDSLIVRVHFQSDAGPRFGRYTAVTRNPSVAVVLDDLRPLTIVAVDPGTTWVVVTEQHGTRDSAQVVVRQRPAAVTLSRPIVGYIGRTAQLTAVVSDRRGNPIAGAPLTFQSANPAIATVTAAGLATFVGTGTGSIIATSPEGPADTSTLVTRGPPPLALSAPAMHTGTGLLSDIYWVENPYDAVDPWVRLTVTDTGLARVPDSVRYVGEGGTFRVTGRQAGSTLLIASAPMMAPDTARITVSTARVSLVDWTFPAADPRDLPAGVNGDLAIRLQDSLGTFRDAADSVAVVVVSSDTSIVTLPQNGQPYVVRPLNQGIPLFPALPRDTGRASVIATAPGYLPDTVRYRVTALPGLVFQPRGTQSIGAGQIRLSDAVASITTSLGFARDETPIPVTFARANASVATFPTAVTIPPYTTGAALPYLALAPGADTIVATAPGFAPDTLVLLVTPPRLLLADTVTRTVSNAKLLIAVGDTLGRVHRSNDALAITATPADPAVALPSSSVIPGQWWTDWWMDLQVVDTGTTTVTVRDDAGTYPSRDLALVVELDTTLWMTEPAYGTPMPAPRQRFPEGALRVRGPEGQVVRLEATDPAVLRIPDSIVLGTIPTAFPLAAGDRTGASRVIVRGRGFATDTSAALAVGPGRLVLDAPTSAFVGGSGYTATVTAVGPDRVALPLDTAATFTLVPLDGGIGVPSAVLIADGATSTQPQALTFDTPGTRRLAVEDRRPIPVPYAGDTVTISVVAPSLRLQPYPSPVVGVGQRLPAAIERPWPVTAGALTVSVMSRTQRTVSPATRSIPAGATSVEYGIEGRSSGPDTLIVSAPGHVPDTVAIWVSEGTVTVRDFPSSLRVGDSVSVVLEVRDSAGGQHAVVSATPFSILGDGGLAFSDSQRSISTVTVATGLGVTPPFWVKAVGPAGTARVRFYNLTYVERVFTTSVVTGANTSPP